MPGCLIIAGLAGWLIGSVVSPVASLTVGTLLLLLCWLAHQSKQRRRTAHGDDSDSGSTAGSSHSNSEAFSGSGGMFGGAGASAGWDSDGGSDSGSGGD